jgi:hypothetical protein
MDYHCGPYWMPKWLKRILSYWFNDECGIHDKVYAEGVLTKDECDFLFFKNLINKSNKSFIKSFISFIFFWVAYKYGQDSWDRNRRLHG